MSAPQRQIKLGAFVQATGHHVAAWLHPGSQPDAGLNFQHYAALAQSAEAAKFDLLFVADSPGGYANVEEPEVFSRNGKTAHFEPITLWSALSALTTHIGFVATSSTTYEDPYTTARKFASLDWISGGRAAWNLVTTGADVSANFSQAAQVAHADRYHRAEEYIEVVKGLWDSYEDDAFVRDRASGLFLDADKIHQLNHRGEYFQVRGPLNIARPPQGHPVIVQAGASDAGRELAGRTAEVVFTANLELADAQEFYADIKSRAGRYGRASHEVLIMPGIFPVLGGTEAEAQANYEEIQALVSPEVAWSILKRHYAGVDLSGYSLDDLAPPLPTDTNGSKSRLKLVSDLVERKRPTLRELYRAVSTARGHRTVVGTPEQIADAIQTWFDQGAADGFNLMPPVLPAGLTDFIEQVLPILRQRGLFRTEYEGRTLRENLGLARPANRFAAGRASLAAAE